jgi:hypothetical protein
LENQKPKVILFFFILLDIQSLFPEILTHLGPRQMGILKELLSKQMKNVNKISENTIPEQNEDDIPDLVENFEEVSKKLE